MIFLSLFSSFLPELTSPQKIFSFSYSSISCSAREKRVCRGTGFELKITVVCHTKIRKKAIK